MTIDIDGLGADVIIERVESVFYYSRECYIVTDKISYMEYQDKPWEETRALIKIKDIKYCMNLSPWKKGWFRRDL